MFLRDEPGASPDNQARMPELLDEYKSGRVRLLAQARELERLREQVRASAEREAAAIVTTARRNVRQVLLDARRELLVLVAQLQAVGCDAPADGTTKYIEGETSSAASVPIAAPDAAAQPEETSEVVSGARRDVREVLVEAQTELLALAEEARELRARIARQHGAIPESDLSAAVEPPMSFVDEEAAATMVEEAAEPPRVEDSPVPYMPLASGRRVWVAVAAALVFAAIGLTLVLAPRRTLSATNAALPPSAAPTAKPEPPKAPPTPAPAPSPQTAAASVPASSGVSVRIEAKRPSWIRTTVDGRADVGRVFDAGETRTITAREEIVMRAGDAGAVLVSVNGAEPRALGINGRVATRRFGRPAATAPPAPLQAASSPSQPAASESEPEPASTDGTTGTQGPPPSTRGTNAEREVARATQRWFEAYFTGDTAAMNDIAAPDFAMLEQRTGSERIPATMRGVDRSLQKVQIEVAGDGAVMSATLTERVTVEGRPREYVCLVSGVWIRTDGQWRLKEVRFIDPFRVGG